MIKKRSREEIEIIFDFLKMDFEEKIKPKSNSLIGRDLLSMILWRERVRHGVENSPELFRSLDLKTLNKMPTDVMFDNVVLLGSESFKYMTVPEYCKTVAEFLDTVIINGNAVVCLPILHLQYHRLRYNTQQIVKHIDLTFANYSIQDVYRDQTEFYLKITREI